MDREFACPLPPAWARVHSSLLRKWKRTGAEGDAPPIPLILGSWWDTSNEQKYTRWMDTIAWARTRGMSDLLTVGADEWHPFRRATGPLPEDLYDSDMLTYAAEEGDLPEISRLLAKGTRDESPLNGESSAVWRATAEGQLAAAMLLLDQRLAPLSGDEIQELLSLAVCRGHQALVSLLLEIPADSADRKALAEFALGFAVANGDIAMVARFIATGVSVEMTNAPGEPIIYEAVRHSHVELAETLVRAGAPLGAIREGAWLSELVANYAVSEEMLDWLGRNTDR